MTTTATYAIGTFVNPRTGYKTHEIHTAGCQDLNKASKVWTPKVQYDTAWSLQKFAAHNGTAANIAPCAL